MKRAVLALEDGSVFEGESFGAAGEVTGEVVFHTSPFGYQEILTDPSYVQQIVTMAATQIGNVGTNDWDNESERPRIAGFVVRQACAEPSNWRSEASLSEYLVKAGIPGIAGLDTRRLVRHLRSEGAKRGVLSSENISANALIDRAKQVRSMEGYDLATLVSTKKVYEFTRPTRLMGPDRAPPPHRFHVVAYDYGLKTAMLELLVDRGCKITVVPASHSAADVLAMKPDGIFLTNGPGDPAAVVGAQKQIQALLGKLPVFGICLGHQLLALSLGGRTWKMKFGHRGANHPVQDLSTGKVEITSQNHGFAVDAESMKGKAVVTHLNLNDNTVEGIAAPDLHAYSVQYHPESSPGPHDARYLFGRFIDSMEKRRS